MSCAEIALIPTQEKKMKDGEPGPGGGGSESVQNEKQKSRKRKSEEVIVSPNGSKKARKWKHRFKTKRQKFPKKPRSVDGDAPKTTQKRKIRRQRRMTESFNAPFNSTQFIMNDHVDEAVKHLNSTLNVKHKKKDEGENDSESDVDYSMERPVRRITRARESSFSIDSDEDYYYSSPEDEEEFVNKEFIKDYDSVRNDRLIDMSKDELINEYLQMEQRIEALEKRLSNKSSQESSPKPSNHQVSDTIKHFQKEIHRLESENSQLKKANSTSVSCSSCSSSSSSDSSSSESESEEDEEVEESKDFGNVQDVDTGYESGQSNKKSMDPNEEKEVVVIRNQDQNSEEEKVQEEEIHDDTISVNCITSTSQS